MRLFAVATLFIGFIAAMVNAQFPSVPGTPSIPGAGTPSLPSGSDPQQAVSAGFSQGSSTLVGAASGIPGSSQLTQG